VLSGRAQRDVSKHEGGTISRIRPSIRSLAWLDFTQGEPVEVPTYSGKLR
jgi:hypothetical protein